MSQLRLLRLALCVLSTSAALAACGDGSKPTDSSAKPVWEQMQACGLTGQFRVKTAPASTCDDWPRAEETVSVEGEGNAVTLRAGLLELPVTAGSEACTFVAAGCASSAASPDGSVEERYFAPSMVLRADDAGPQLVARAVDVMEKYVGPCAEANFEMTAVNKNGCDPVGNYEANAEASISSGACDLTWGPGKVTVTKGADGYVVDWAGTKMDELTLDTATCTLRGSRGVSPNFWIYNSASRSAEIELRFAEGSLKGTVKDKLDGVTFDGKVCPGATYQLLAGGPPPRDARSLEPTCSVPKPPACGDGVCESGEGCSWCAECACGDGKECASDQVCRTSCTLQTEATACAAGERCSAVGSSHDPAIDKYDDLYCEPAGAGKQGDSCAHSNDCGAGLICHVAVGASQGTCSRPCGNDFPACLATEACRPQGDGTENGYLSSAVYACEKLAGPGEDCTTAVCQDPYQCHEYCVNKVCSTYCSKYCSSNADCPAALPVCGPLGVCNPN